MCALKDENQLKEVGVGQLKNRLNYKQ